jgi:hypothetical protein
VLLRFFCLKRCLSPGIYDNFFVAFPYGFSRIGFLKSLPFKAHTFLSGKDSVKDLAWKISYLISHRDVPETGVERSWRSCETYLLLVNPFG